MLKVNFLLIFLSTSLFGKPVKIDLANDYSITGELVKSNLTEVFVDFVLGVQITSSRETKDEPKHCCKFDRREPCER